MKRVGIVVACVIAAVALGLGLYYYWVGREIADIRYRLVSEEELTHPDDPATIAGIKLAPIQCERVYDLRANPIARRLRGDEIRALWSYCERLADLASGLGQTPMLAPDQAAPPLPQQ